MKILGLIAVVFALAGCSEGLLSPEGRFGLDEYCLKGVVYYTSHNQIAPAFKPDGTLYTCK